MKRGTTITKSGDLPEGYTEFVLTLKNRIRSAQVKAAVSVNRELVLLYWQIGHEILIRQEREGWGTKVIGRLSSDLIHEFPAMKGFSARNLKYMRKFAGARAVILQLCKSCLHKLPGIIILPFLIK